MIRDGQDITRFMTKGEENEDNVTYIAVVRGNRLYKICCYTDNSEWFLYPYRKVGPMAWSHEYSIPATYDAIKRRYWHS